MNRKTLSIVCSLGLIACGAVLDADTAKTEPGNVTVVFDHPEKFTDVKDGYLSTDKGRDGILGDIKEYIVDRATSYLQKGMKLEVKFTDIDLAGDYEPQLGPRFSDVRIMKDIYPPRLDLEFRITDADGKVLSEGKRKLTDLDYLRRVILPDNDPLRYEKDILKDWLRGEIGAAAQGAR
jgi:Protein of unknown function (DUF3016)